MPPNIPVNTDSFAVGYRAATLYGKGAFVRV
jgi:hypothetical protein